MAPRKGQFNTGHKPWNDGIKKATNSGKTHFKNGGTPWNKGIVSEEEMKRKAKLRTKKWKENNPGRHNELNKISRQKMMSNPEYREKKRIEASKRAKQRKDMVYNHYGMVCNCCGETELLFLTLDHVNNDGHLDKSKSGYRKSGTTIYGKIIKDGFPNTYQILCMNCNFGKARNNGVCPHKSNGFNG